MLSSPDAAQDLAAGFYAAAAQLEDWNAPWTALCTAFEAEFGLLYRQSRPSSAMRVLASRNWPNRPGGAAPEGVHVLSATLPIDGTALVGLGLHRPLDLPDFTAADRHALDSVGRHVAGALKLEAMLTASRAATDLRTAALDLLPHGVLVCTGAGALVFANRAAEELAEASDFDLGLGRACIAGARESDTQHLEALIARVAAGKGGGSARLTRPRGAPPIAAIVEPLPVRLETAVAGQWQRTLVMITLRDMGATTDASPALLMDLFGLTPAEAGIVPQLLAGDTASLIAQSRGVAVGTVKAQLAKVLAKTGAANLRALASMITSLA